MTIPLIAALAPATVMGEGDAAGWLVAAVGETAEAGVFAVPQAPNNNTRTDATKDANCRQWITFPE